MILKFYPGSLLIKRLSKLCLVFSVGFNCFLNELQNELFDKGEEILVQSETLARPAAEAAELVQENVLPYLQSLEQTRLGVFIRSSYDMPDVATLESGLSEVRRYRELLLDYHEAFRKIAFIITITSNLIWVAIVLALVWLLFDIRRGNARSFVLLALLASIPFNAISYFYLDRFFSLQGGEALPFLTTALTGF